MLYEVITGERLPEQWGSRSESVDFYDMKGDVEALLELTGAPEAFTFRAASHPALHPGQCAAILREDRQVGIMGMLHPARPQIAGLARRHKFHSPGAAAV